MLSTYLQHSGKAASRDKVFRLMQYTSKLLSHFLKDPQVLESFKQFESILSTSRKTFRLGKTIDMLNGAKQAYSIPDPILQKLLVLARSSQAVYFFYDMLAWCIKAGIFKADLQRVSMKSSQCWTVALFFLLLRDLYEVRQRQKQQHQQKSCIGGFVEVLANNPAVSLDMLKNMADLVVALNMVKKVSLSQGTVGICGVVSSLLGLLQIVQPNYKLLP